MNRAAIQRSINAVFIPERITQPDCHIVGAVLINGELIGGRAVISQGHKGLGNRNNAGIAVRLGIVVNENFSKLGLLLLGISGQIVPTVIDLCHLGIGFCRGISAFHVVIHMRECPRTHIVIVPIGKDRNERLRWCIIGEVIHALHPVFCSIVGVGCATVVFAQIFRGVIDLPVPTVGRHTEEYLVWVHHPHSIIVHTLKPTSRRDRTRSGTCPSHTVGHNGCGVAVFIQITVNAPVLTADRAVDRSHTRQADVYFLGRVIGFHGAVNMGEHGGGRFVGGVIVAFFQVDIHTAAPGVFLHNSDEFGAESVLCTVRVVTQGFEDGVCTVIGNGKQPTDVGPFVDVGQHIADGNTALGDGAGLIHLKGKQTDGIDAVTVIAQGFIHSGIAHECPDHDAFAFEFIHQIASPPSVICCSSNSTLADFPVSRLTLCLESQAALY